MLVLAAFTSAGAAEAIRVTADFDRGSIGELREVAPGHLRGPTRHWVQASGQNDQRYWFYFRLDGVAGREVTIELTDMIGVYRGRPHRGIIDNATQPVVSYDGVTWERVTDVDFSDEGVWTLRHRFARSPAWIAYAHPYTLGQANAWIDHVAKHLGVARESIGRSVDGRPLTLLTIGPARPKKTVLLTSLIHPGEDASGYLLEGVVAFLLGDDPRAQSLRRAVRFEIVPTVNPDGLVRGHARLNAHLEDLNAAWHLAKADDAGEPEIVALRSWLARTHGGPDKLDVHLDLHCAGQRRTNIAIVTSDSWLLQRFVPLIGAAYPVKPVNGGFAGSMAGFTQARYGAHAATFEITQSRFGEGPVPYLNPDDYRKAGRVLVESLHALLTREVAAERLD